MNQRLAKVLARLGYTHEKTETAAVDNVRHKARYVAVAIKVKDGRMFMAQHLGTSAEDAEHKLVAMLERK